MYHIKKRVSVISWLFILLIFLQGCVVYQKKSVTLERTFQEGLKTKVVTDSGNTFKFKRIGFEDGKFYGVMISNGEITKVSLQENELSKIILKNENMSTLLTIGTSIVSVFGILIIWFLIDTGGGDLDFSGSVDQQ